MNNIKNYLKHHSNMLNKRNMIINYTLVVLYLLLTIFFNPSQWRSEDARGPRTTDAPGPLPILHNLIPLTPPHIHPY